MDINVLIRKYRKQGVQLWMEKEKLCYSAPKGSLNEQQLEELKQHKKDIIKYLVKKGEESKEVEDKYGEFELTDLQTAYLVGKTSGYNFGGVGCNFYIELDVTKYSSSQITNSWDNLLSRHEMLNAIVLSSGKQKILKKTPNYTIKNEIYDNESSFLLSRTRISKRNFGSDKWPLFEIELAHHKEKKILQFSIDMLIVDATSMMILLNEWVNLLENNDNIEPAGSFKKYLESEEKRKHHVKYIYKYNKDREYWMSRLPDIPELPNLPLKLLQLNNNNDIIHLQKEISCKKFNMLEKICARRGVTLSSLLLTLYSKLLAAFSINQNFCINTTTINRDINCSNSIVGEFTNVILLEIKNTDNDLISSIQKIQNQLIKDLSHSAFSGIQVIRSKKELLNEDWLYPYVFTSTLGMPIELPNDVSILYRSSQTPQVLIDCQVSTINNDLVVCWDVRKGCFYDGFIEQLFLTYIKIIEDIIEDEELLVKPFSNSEFIFDNSPYLKKWEIWKDTVDEEVVKKDGFTFKKLDINNLISTYEGVDKCKTVNVEIDYINEVRPKKNLQTVAFVTADTIDRQENSEMKNLFSDTLNEEVIKGMENINDEKIQYKFSLINDFSMSTIMKVFLENNIFTNDKKFSYEEIVSLLDCHQKYYFLVKRWIKKLVEYQYIRYFEDSDLYAKNSEIDKNFIFDINQSIKNKLQMIDEDGAKYIVNAAQNVQSVLSGNSKPQEILFPEGDIQNAFNVYNSYEHSKAIISPTIESIELIINQLQKEGNKEIKILEIGAGTGSFTDHLLPRISKSSIQYYFTDISKFFLNKAKGKYTNYDWIKYELFDINEPLEQQKLTSNYFDIIVSNNVMHVARDAMSTFKKIKKLLKMNGYMVTIDALEEPPILLISMAMLYDLEVIDERKEQSNIFFTIEQYYENFRSIDAEVLYEMPLPKHKLEFFEQKAFICKLNPKYENINTNSLKEYLKEKTVDFAVPDDVILISNDEINNIENEVEKLLIFERQKNNEKSSEINFPRTELEKAIEKEWRKVLGYNDNIDVNSNFFMIGGDSLLIAQVTGEMTNNITQFSNLSWEQSMKLLLENNTIKSLANALENISLKKDDINNVQFEIQKGKEGEEIFVFPSDGTGTVAIYSDIIEKLIEKKPCATILGYNFGYKSNYIDLDENKMIQEFGREIGKDLEHFTETKSIIIVGHCFGGAVGLETSRYLNEKNISNKLIMIDSKRYEKYMRHDMVIENIFSYLFNMDIVEEGLSPDLSELKSLKAIERCLVNSNIETLENLKKHGVTITQKMKEFYSGKREQRINIICNMLGKKFGKNDNEIRQMEFTYKIFDKSFHAMYEYFPKNYNGKIVEFRATEENIEIIENIEVSYFSDLARKSNDIFYLKGNHINCIKGKNISEKLMNELCKE